jgi:inner membrane protein
MRNSVLARLLVMGLLTVLLLIPLAMVLVVVAERASRRQEAVTRFNEEWGGAQIVSGPVLTVPYTTTWTDNMGRPQRSTGHAHLLPRDLHIDGVLNTEVRTRGIFEVVVYRTSLKMAGRFVRPDLSWVRPTPQQFEWQEATVSLAVADPRGLTRRATMTWNGRELPFAGGIADVGLFQSGIHARVPELDAIQAGTELPFAFTLELNGTRDLRFLPAAEETMVSLSAEWPHPSFTGGPLPTYELRPSGFSANWRVPDFGRPYAARWTNGGANRDQLIAQAQKSAFGVSLIHPVDIYQQAERAVKYAVLFIVLTFSVFFLHEIFHDVLLHPMHYAFVGFALCIFYLLLVSISEHAGFDFAYSVSAAATTALIAGYSRAILGSRRRTVSVGVGLAALYGYLYLLLRLEDYALLAGSIGLFVVLALMMYVTRRMDWYELKLGRQEGR